MSQNSTEKSKPKDSKDKMLLEFAQKEFSWDFLEKKELQATYLIGLYFNRSDYLQSTIMKTKGLQKKMRYLFDNLDFEKLLKIFYECNQILFSVQQKKKWDNLPYKHTRSTIEQLMGKKFSDSISSEELSLAFMMGYDAHLRYYADKKKQDVQTDNDNE